MSGPHQDILHGRRILVVEDTLLVAELIVSHLEDWGITVVGPASRLQPALKLAGAEALDGALLDVNLAGEYCFPVADVLITRGIPVVFVTGYNNTAIPAKYAGIPRLHKPFETMELSRLVKSHFGRATHLG